MEAEPLEVDSPNRKRRRFQFRLRTLLIVVTLLAVLLGYVGRQAEIVRARKSWFGAHKSWFNSRFSRSAVIFNFGTETLVHGDSSKAPSLLRRWIGDDDIKSIDVHQEPVTSELADMKFLFPEADIRLCTP
jgi:hypothetical protein